MRKPLMFALSVLTASVAFGDPVITSVSPDVGPIAGGSAVTLKGTGFSNNCIICSPPFADPAVFFGATQSPEVHFIDATTVEAIAPAHLPTTVSITIRQLDGSDPFTLDNTFTFEGDPESGFEPILFPIFSAPVNGQFDSLFETTARVAGKNLDTVILYGEEHSCQFAAPIARSTVYDPVILSGFGRDDRTLETACAFKTGRIFWVSKPFAGSLAANLRVADTSRIATSHGTEIPVVRRSDFTTDKIVLLGVPYDPRFRATLRIYALEQTSAVVNLEIGGLGRQVFLEAGENIFEPSTATIGDFPRKEDIDPIHFRDRVTVQSEVPIYAFISVTNNETQQITTITPN